MILLIYSLLIIHHVSTNTSLDLDSHSRNRYLHAIFFLNLPIKIHNHRNLGKDSQALSNYIDGVM